MSVFTPELLFKTSALLWALAVPGHISFGLASVHPGITAGEQKATGLNRDARQGLVGARVVWDNWNVWSAGMAILNYKWARSGAPTATEDILVLFLFAVGHIVTGLRYARGGVPGPAALLVSSSLASIGAYLLSKT